jgi:hypothetical protein
MRKWHAWISYGQFGELADHGNLLRLCEQVKALGVDIMRSPYQWSQTADVVRDVLAVPEADGIIGGGASLGDNEAVEEANILHDNVRHRTVDLLFGFQRSRFGRQFEVPENVVKAIEIHCPNLLLDPFGDDPWTLKPGNTRTKLKNIPVLAQHPGDFGQGADIILAAIRDLVKQP